MLTDFLAECGLASLIDEPTRENSLLDLLLSTDAALINNPRVTPNFGTSDHCGISFEVTGSSRSVVADLHRNYNHCDWAQINDYLLGYDWDFEFGSCCSLEDMGWYLYSIIPFFEEKYKYSILPKNLEFRSRALSLSQSLHHARGFTLCKSKGRQRVELMCSTLSLFVLYLSGTPCHVMSLWLTRSLKHCCCPPDSCGKMVEMNTKKTIRQTTPNTRFRRHSMIEGRNDTKGSLKIISWGFVANKTQSSAKSKCDSRSSPMLIPPLNSVLLKISPKLEKFCASCFRVASPRAPIAAVAHRSALAELALGNHMRNHHLGAHGKPVQLGWTCSSMKLCWHSPPDPLPPLHYAQVAESDLADVEGNILIHNGEQERRNNQRQHSEMTRTTLVIALLIVVLHLESLPVWGWYSYYSRPYYGHYGRWDRPSRPPNGGWNNPQRPPYNRWGPHTGQPGGSPVSPPIGQPGGSTMSPPVSPPGGSPVSPPGSPPMPAPVPANTPAPTGPQTSTPRQKTSFDFVFSPGLFGLPMLTGFGVNGKIFDPFLQGKNTSNYGRWGTPSSPQYGRWGTPSRPPYGRWDTPSRPPNGGWNNPQRPPYNPWGPPTSQPGGSPVSPPVGPPGGIPVSPPLGPPGGSPVSPPVGPPGGSPVPPPGSPPMPAPVPANTPAPTGPQTSTPRQKTSLDFAFSKGLFGLPMLTGFGINGKIWDPFLQGNFSTSQVETTRQAGTNVYMQGPGGSTAVKPSLTKRAPQTICALTT
ncbi:hypothetical protein Tcan_01517 [Toxocara canis]|uniref:Uncharacterized protein n=1 Tax=Toxocara canis TaxID=6265 RepID=A0A0B2URY2_TOXCA|nr:hypothetical protein Tcan_01517 [Toxocara canis]